MQSLVSPSAPQQSNTSHPQAQAAPSTTGHARLITSTPAPAQPSAAAATMQPNQTQAAGAAAWPVQYDGVPDPGTRRWTKEEDLLLCYLHSDFGQLDGLTWADIAAGLRRCCSATAAAGLFFISE